MSLVWKSELFTESLGTHDYPMIGGGGRRGEGGDDGGDRKGGRRGGKRRATKLTKQVG